MSRSMDTDSANTAVYDVMQYIYCSHAVGTSRQSASHAPLEHWQGSTEQRHRLSATLQVATLLGTWFCNHTYQALSRYLGFPSVIRNNSFASLYTTTSSAGLCVCDPGRQCCALSTAMQQDTASARPIAAQPLTDLHQNVLSGCPRLQLKHKTGAMRICCLILEFCNLLLCLDASRHVVTASFRLATGNVL